MNFVKTFPKTRVCVINIFPAFKHALKKAIEFTSNNGITLNSPDGKRILIGFCLKAIEASYNNVNSEYPKVLCISIDTDNESIRQFVTNHLDKIVEKLPFPYCGQQYFNSPDLQYAALKQLEQIKKRETYEKFAKKLNLRSV